MPVLRGWVNRETSKCTSVSFGVISPFSASGFWSVPERTCDPCGVYEKSNPGGRLVDRHVKCGVARVKEGERVGAERRIRRTRRRLTCVSPSELIESV